MAKNLGVVFTPDGYAQILTNWAIHSNKDTVLDLGVGEGVFVFQAFDRLRELGASIEDAADQIYGSEIDKSSYDKFITEARKRDLVFKNLKNDDFFVSSLPDVDVIVGNPPYVRRRGMDEHDLSTIRKSTLNRNPGINKKDLSNLSDLYSYFLLASLPSLRSGGRLAVIVADTWLSSRYGVTLRKYLLNEFYIDQIISLDRRVFDNIQVKAVLILALKKGDIPKKYHKIRFARVRNGLPIKNLSSFVLGEDGSHSKGDIVVREIKSNSLNHRTSWGNVIKSTELFETIRNKKIIIPMKEIADIHIGFQTLAKDFFVISREDKENKILDVEYLAPFAYSIAQFDNPVIKDTDIPSLYVFYCSKPKEELQTSKALEYIKEGELITVAERGTGKTVTGYHNKKRIKKANRPYWYDIKTEVMRRGIAEILLPRFVYKKYLVLWNVAKYVPGGALISVIPKKDLFAQFVDTRVYLAILTSAFSEIVFRIYAHVYGGGSTNINISALREAPTINITQLSEEQKRKLVDCYDGYIGTNNKDEINRAVYSLLDLTEEQIKLMNELLDDLILMAVSARKAAHPYS